MVLGRRERMIEPICAFLSRAEIGVVIEDQDAARLDIPQEEVGNAAVGSKIVPVVKRT